MKNFYIASLETLCREHGWGDPMYGTYEASRSTFGSTCLITVNGRTYQSIVQLESYELAKESAAKQAYMACVDTLSRFESSEANSTIPTGRDEIPAIEPNQETKPDQLRIRPENHELFLRYVGNSFLQGNLFQHEDAGLAGTEEDVRGISPAPSASSIEYNDSNAESGSSSDPEQEEARAPIRTSSISESLDSKLASPTTTDSAHGKELPRNPPVFSWSSSKSITIESFTWSAFTDSTEESHSQNLPTVSGVTESTLRPPWSTTAVSVGEVPSTKRYALGGKRAGLGIYINEVFIHAVADTGSDENSIREEFAEQYGLQVKKNEKLNHKFQLANGREIYSIGTISASFSLDNTTSSQSSALRPAATVPYRRPRQVIIVNSRYSNTPVYPRSRPPKGVQMPSPHPKSPPYREERYFKEPEKPTGGDQDSGQPQLGEHRMILFHVFKSLAAPVIVGRGLLQTTETMTKHSGRLLAYEDDEILLNVPKVMHMNLPQQRLRCYLDTDLIYANADTGSELNLISLEFATERGLHIRLSGEKETKLVMLADGSTAELSGLYRARFFPFENPPNKFACHLRPKEETFYILEGLTTDVLIGAELLFKISAFTEQQSAFIDLDDQGILSNINTITWLTKREKKLASASNQQASSRPFPTATELEVAFQLELNDDDAREQHLQQTNEFDISRLNEPERSTRQASENGRRRVYNETRTKRIQEHDRKLAVMAQQGRNGDSSRNN